MKKKIKHAGRPKKPDGSALTERLQIRLNKEQMGRLEARAKLGGLNGGEWSRKILLENLG